MRLSLNKHTYQKSMGLRIFSKSRAWIAKKRQVRFIAHIFEVNSSRARRERINEYINENTTSPLHPEFTLKIQRRSFLVPVKVY